MSKQMITGLVPSPDWIRDLIIYEIATPNFTSPNGPESGTFGSLAERLPYLQSLGVTGIWLTGNNAADSSHFYNIWTQYATIRPDTFDDRFGTGDDFSTLVDAAHALGIRIFLDVITHGVMAGSPLIDEHPDWFSGGSWGMVDYDWSGNHPELDRWWVQVWLDFVLRYDVDGFRLDVAMYRPDLWQEIRQRAWEAGHPIVIFNEIGPEKHGVVDFLQWDIRLKYNTETLDLTKTMIERFPYTVIDQAQGPACEYQVTFQLADKTEWVTEDITFTGNPFGAAAEPSAQKPGKACSLKTVRRERSLVRVDRTGGEYFEDIVVLTVEGLPAGARVENVRIKNTEGYWWMLDGNVASDYRVSLEIENGTATLSIPPRHAPGSVLSAQLSCHDDGWDGFPPGENPYVARGSRYAFGYAFLFSPAVPIFMSGEEFDAAFVPVPRLSPRLFGGASPGAGTWLYGSWIQWEQPSKAPHRDMLTDVQKMIALRKSNRDLIRPLTRGENVSHFLPFPLDDQTDSDSTPYGYANGERLLLIAGNPSSAYDKELTIPIPLSTLPMGATERYTVRDLWNGGDRVVSRDDVELFRCSIRRDRVPGGGVGVWELRPVPKR